MKHRTLLFAFALGFSSCGARTVVAQQLSLSAPIIIQFSQIDRYGVSVWPEKRALDGAKLGLPYQSMKPDEVDALVRDGIFLHRSVWIMDGQTIIARCSLVGDFIYQPAPKAETKIGLLLGFDTVEEAQKVGALVKLEPSIDELLRQQKSRLDDKRFWIY